MWQKCPICDGEGRVTSNGSSSSVHQVCPTCNGARIISEWNGLPPKSVAIPNDDDIESGMNQRLFLSDKHAHFNSGAKAGFNQNK